VTVYRYIGPRDSMDTWSTDRNTIMISATQDLVSLPFEILDQTITNVNMVEGIIWNTWNLAYHCR
jgi:hypothetical protein